MTTHVLFLLTGLVFACSQGDRPAEANQMKTALPLYANRVVQHFSDESDNDTLYVTVNGESLLTGTVYLKITNRGGKVIFQDNFPTTALIDHEGLIDPEKDNEHIQKQIDGFFDTTHFSKPAIEFSKQVTLPDSIRKIWMVVESDPTTVYFLYRASTDSLKGVAYSKRLGRVIVSTYPNLHSPHLKR